MYVFTRNNMLLAPVVLTILIKLKMFLQTGWSLDEAIGWYPRDN